MKFEFELKESIIKKRPSLVFAILLIIMAVSFLFRREDMLGKLISTFAFAAGLLGVYRYFQHKASPVNKPRFIFTETGGEMRDYDEESETVLFAWIWADIQLIKLRFPNTTPVIEFQTEGGSFHLVPGHFKDKFGMIAKLLQFCQDIPGAERLQKIATPKSYLYFLAWSYLISIITVISLLIVIPLIMVWLRT